jgi:drug/metabolite transporter (DMT)-like permease
MTTPSSSPRVRRLAFLAWMIVCVVWGTTYLAIRVALESVPVALLGGLRWTAAGTLMLAVLAAAGKPLPPRREWPALAFVGCMMTVVGNGFVVWAEQFVASGLAAVVVATVPFWNVAIEAALPGGERVSARTLAGLTVGFAGILVLVWPELAVSGAASRFVLGILALQAACLGWAIGTSFTKRRPASGHPLGAPAFQMLFGGLVFLGLASLTGEWSRLTFTGRSGAAMIYLLVAGSILGYSCYVYALRHLPVSTVSLYAYVNPIIAVVLGSALLGEPFTIHVVIAAALVLAGIAIVRGRRLSGAGASRD